MRLAKLLMAHIFSGFLGPERQEASGEERAAARLKANREEQAARLAEAKPPALTRQQRRQRARIAAKKVNHG
jgi:hypothetical protein